MMRLKDLAVWTDRLRSWWTQRNHKRVHLLSRTAWIGKQVCRFYFMNFVLFCPSKCMLLFTTFEFTWLRLVLKTPVGNRALPESDMCYHFHVPDHNKGSNFFLLVCLFVFSCHYCRFFCFFVFVFKSDLSTNLLEINIEGGSVLSLKYPKTSST